MTELTNILTAVRAKWISQSKTNRFLMIFGAVAGFVAIALFITPMTSPTNPSKVAAIVPTAIAPTTLVAVRQATATPTSASTTIPTSMPTATATPTSVPTLEAIACTADKTIANSLQKIYGKDNEFGLKFYNSSNGTVLGQTWLAAVISTGKVEDITEDPNGQKYILHILTGLVFGSNHSTLTPMEVKIVYDVTLPNGQYLWGKPEWDDEKFTPFGSNLSIDMDKGQDGGRDWDLCMRGGVNGNFPTEYREFCKLAKDFSLKQQSQGKILADFASGVQPPEDWVWIGGRVNLFYDNQSKHIQIDPPLTCKP